MARRGFDRRWRTIRLADPAAGTDWIMQAPGSSYWRVVSLRARLVTAITVASRISSLAADDGTRIWYQQETTVAQTAGQTIDHVGFAGSQQTAGVPAIISYGLPFEGILLLPGFRLRSNTTALQAGDQWSLITALVDEIPSDLPYVSNAGLTREVVIQE